MDGATRSIRRGGALLMQSHRLLVGGLAIGIGCFGMVLPLLPGMPFLILGSLIIGRRVRSFRRASVAGSNS